MSAASMHVGLQQVNNSLGKSHANFGGFHPFGHEVVGKFGGEKTSNASKSVCFHRDCDHLNVKSCE